MPDLVQLMRAEMLTALIETLGADAAKAGSRFSATVSAVPEEGPATLLVAGVPLPVVAEGPARASLRAALSAGRSVTLRVETAEAGLLRATLLPQGEEPALDARAPPQGLRELPAPAQQPSAAALGQAVARAAAGQQPLGPLLSNLSAVAAPAGRAVAPPQVVEAATRALAAGLDAAQITGPGLRRAVALSGVMHEALVAQRAAPGGGAADPAPLALAAGDLKSALLALRNALENLGAGEPAMDAEAHPAPQRPATAEPPAQSAVAPSPAPAMARPPTRDAAPVGQPPEPPDFAPLDAARPENLALLARQTDGALERLRLLQAASLPPDARPADAAAPPAQRWHFELPLRYHDAPPQVLPLTIERDARRQGGGTDMEDHIWRVRFALDGEPLGPLQAVVAWQLRRLSVTLVAGRETTRALLRQEAGDLREALKDADHAAGASREIEIDILAQAPAPDPPPRPGQLLDRRT